MKVKSWTFTITLPMLLILLAGLSPLGMAKETNPLESFIWGCQEENFREIYLSTHYLVGEDVEELENRLQELGFNPGPIDGIFDETTAEAVKQFQKNKNLPVTGIVDKKTWQALGQEYEPTDTNKTPPPKGQIKIVIDREKRTLTVYSDGKPYKQYPIAVGKSNTPSPVGEWKVISKSKEWGSGFGTRWIGLNVPWGIYGIHGTNKPWSIGQAASKGCFRMYNKHVEEIYPWVKIGTPVIVIGKPDINYERILKKGSIGQDVVLIQQRLREEKLLWLPADGRFGAATERALKLYQMLYGLPVTGEVNKAVWDKMVGQD